MTTAVEMQSEYRNLPILSLTESPANPRRSFDEGSLNELAESIRSSRRALAAARSAQRPQL